MRKRPFFIRNPSGACVPYAVANLLHFYKDHEGGRKAREIIKDFPAIEYGRLISEVDQMLKTVSPSLLLYVQYYDEIKAGLMHEYFTALNNLEEASKHFQQQAPDKEFFFMYIFFIEKNGVEHAISGYLSLDNFTLLIMDSQKTGTVEIFEIESFFSSYCVYGVGQVAIRNKEQESFKLPITRSKIELFK